MGGYLEDAKRDGAGERQLEVLENAVATGVLDFETVNALVHDTFACFEEAGIGYTEHPPEEPAPGWKYPRYSFDGEADGLTEKQLLALADACQVEHSQFALFVLQDGDLNQEVRDAAMREALPEIRACLEENGVLVDDDATLDEIRTASLDLMTATADAPQTISCWDDLG